MSNIIFILFIVIIMIVAYFLIGSLFAIDEPEPLDWILIWPIMLYRRNIERSMKNG